MSVWPQCHCGLRACVRLPKNSITINKTKPKPFHVVKTLEYSHVGFKVGAVKSPIIMLNRFMVTNPRNRWNKTCCSIKLDDGCSKMNHTPWAAKINKITRVLDASRFPAFTAGELVSPMGFE